MAHPDPPADTELEVSIFGPGYGECVVLHGGGGEWVVIDSCLNEDGQPSALAYLEEMGVPPQSAVRAVIATHWHDDHVRGLADTFIASERAEFVCAPAFTKHEFLTLVARYNENNQTISGSGVRELFRVFSTLTDRSQQPIYALANRPILRLARAEAKIGMECVLTALSPADKQLTLFLDEVSRALSH